VAAAADGNDATGGAAVAPVAHAPFSGKLLFFFLKAGALTFGAASSSCRSATRRVQDMGGSGSGSF